MAKLGRPKKPPSDLMTHSLSVRMTEEEWQLVQRAAAGAKRTPSTWARQMLLDMARACEFAATSAPLYSPEPMR